MMNDDTRALAARHLFEHDESAVDSRGGAGVGFMSSQCRVYLADVHDHLDEVLSNMDEFASTASNLTSYIFNYLS